MEQSSGFFSAADPSINSWNACIPGEARGGGGGEVHRLCRCLRGSGSPAFPLANVRLMGRRAKITSEGCLSPFFFFLKKKVFSSFDRVILKTRNGSPNKILVNSNYESFTFPYTLGNLRKSCGINKMVLETN